MPHANPSPPRSSNLRTALVIGSIALVFFAGVIAKKVLLG